jgi:hypothetical protein
MTTVLEHLNHSVALTDEQIFNRAPAVFSRVADDDRSSAYSFAPTFPIIQELRAEGFDVVDANQGKGDSAYAKHQIILRPRGGANLQKVGDTFAEISLINSHNGRSAVEIGGALLRLACLNGMTIPDGMAETTKVYHKGSTIIDEIIEGMQKAVEGSKGTMDRIKRWGSIQLDRDEQEMFASFAHRLRFGTMEDGEEHFIKAHQLLEVRRREDTGSDLWTIVNRVQEASLMPLIGQSSTGRAISSRAITSIDSRKGINEGLLTMAQVIEQYKAPVMV